MSRTDAIMLSPEQGIEPVVHAATDPHANGGEYYAPAGFMGMRSEPEATHSEGIAADTELARALWDRSTELTGVSYASLDRTKS